MRQLVQAQKGALSFHYCRSPKKEDFQKLKETSLLLLLHYKFNFKTRLKWGMIQLCAQWARPANVQIMSTVHQQQCSADKTVEMFPPDETEECRCAASRCTAWAGSQTRLRLAECTLAGNRVHYPSTLPLLSFFCSHLSYFHFLEHSTLSGTLISLWRGNAENVGLAARITIQ